MDRSCGSPVITENGQVVSHLHFMTNSVKPYCVSVEVLMETGLKLSCMDFRSVAADVVRFWKRSKETSIQYVYLPS